jgi:hypothetical protein
MANLIPREQIEEFQDISGSLSIGGDLEVSGNLFVSQSITIGTDVSDLQQITGSVKISGSLEVDGEIFFAPDTIIQATASFALDSDKFDGIDSVDFGRVETVIYVSSTDGNDDNDGFTIQYPLRTIKRACQKAKEYIDEINGSGSFPEANSLNVPRVNIQIKTGYYFEQAPITVPSNVSLLGDDLRTTVVSPTPQTRKENLFLMNNSTYAYGLRLQGCELDSLTNPTKGFFFTLAPGAFIVTSPYVQNCSAVHTPQDKLFAPLDFEAENPEIGRGPGGMLVDDSVLNPYSPLRSMIVDAYTQVAFNGIGICVKGTGYAQLVSFFTNFSRVGVFCIDGGHASLLNSNTTFGDFGLYASGSRLVVEPDVTTVIHESPILSTTLQSARQDTIDYVWDEFISESVDNNEFPSGLPTGSYTGSFEVFTKRDTGFLIDALVHDTKTHGSSRTQLFVKGFFDDDEVPVFDTNLLPDFIRTYELVYEYYDTQLLTNNSGSLGKIENLLNIVSSSLNSAIVNGEPLSAAIVDTTAAGLIKSSKSDIIDFMWDEFISQSIDNDGFPSGNPVGFYDDELELFTRRDAGILIDSIVQDLNTDGAVRINQFISGLFKSNAVPVFRDPENLVLDFIQTFEIIYTYIEQTILTDDMYLTALIKIRSMIDLLNNTLLSIIVDKSDEFLSTFGSLITSTSHDFSYAGSGVNFLGLPPNQGGIGTTNVNIRIVEENGGRVFHSSGDESGDFFVGRDFKIDQNTGTIQGRTFSRSLFALVTPFTLALES